MLESVERPDGGNLVYPSPVSLHILCSLHVCCSPVHGLLLTAGLSQVKAVFTSFQLN